MPTASHSRRTSPLVTAFAAVVILGAHCAAQEVAVDVTTVAPRLEFRHSAAPNDVDIHNSAKGDVYENVICGRAAPSGAALRATLLSLDRGQYRSGEEVKFDVRIENVGAVPIRLPLSPHRADFQPAHRRKFAYFDMVVAVRITGDRWFAEAWGDTRLYGTEDHAGTMLTLLPHEWLRVIGKGKVTMPASAGGVGYANAAVSIRVDQTLVTPSASATVSAEICIPESQGPGLPVSLTGTAANEQVRIR